MMNTIRTIWTARLVSGAVSAFYVMVMGADARNRVLQEPERVYEGTIKALPIQMILRREGNEILGKYRYMKIGKDVKVQGILRGSDSLTLWEYDEQWNTTGLFTGRIITRTSDGAWESVEGIRTKPNGAGAPASFALRLRSAAASPQILQKSPSASEINGRYQRSGKHTAEINVQLVADGELKIEGEATWSGSPKIVNIGDIAGVCTLQGNQALYADKHLPCNLTITFGKNSLTITGDPSDGSCGGHNVSFNGSYKRVSPKPVFRPHPLR